MCCNRSNNNGNVQGSSGIRRCRCHNRDNDNVQGITRIALRGPGCISGTGRCGRFTANFVQGESGFDDDCFFVSPESGNRRNRRNRCDCCFRCLEDLLSDTCVCPR